MTSAMHDLLNVALSPDATPEDIANTPLPESMRAAVVLAATGVTPDAAPVVSIPSQMLSVTIPVEGSAADVSEAEKAAVAAAIAAEAGVGVSAVAIAVVVKDDGSVELVAYITVDAGRAPVTAILLNSQIPDQETAAALLDAPGVEPSAAPDVGAPSQMLSVTIPVAALSAADKPAVAAVIAANRLRAEVGLGGARTDDVGLGGARTDEARLSDGSSKEVLHMDVSLVGTPVDAGPSTRLEKALSIASSRAPIADAAA